MTTSIFWRRSGRYNQRTWQCSRCGLGKAIWCERLVLNQWFDGKTYISTSIDHRRRLYAHYWAKRIKDDPIIITMHAAKYQPERLNEATDCIIFLGEKLPSLLLPSGPHFGSLQKDAHVRWFAPSTLVRLDRSLFCSSERVSFASVMSRFPPTILAAAPDVQYTPDASAARTFVSLLTSRTKHLTSEERRARSSRHGFVVTDNSHEETKATSVIIGVAQLPSLAILQSQIDCGVMRCPEWTGVTGTVVSLGG
jgi:hypothetical protein